jgi:ABC-type glycerol-3-phosphate transport system substrate-binding protein
MKISLFQGILVGVFALGALIGLFVFATYSSDGSGAGGVGAVVIWGTLPRAELDMALLEMGKIEAKLKSVTYVEKNVDTLPSELASAIATGSGPDLLLASQESLYGLAKFLTPISTDSVSPSAFTGTFIDEGGLFTIPDGSGYYGLPFLVDPLILFWNNDILSSSGIAKPPATWEALVGLVPNLALLTPTKQITRGLIGLGTYDNVYNARAVLSALFLQTRVPISAYGNNGMFTANLGESGSGGPPLGQAVLAFYTQFADPAKVSYTWNTSLPNSRQAFVAGDLALYLGFASESRVLSALNPNLNYNVAQLPQPATATGKVTYGLVYALMIPRGARNPSGAFEVAALLTNNVEQEIAATFTSLAPSTRSLLGTLPADPVRSVAYTSALYSKGWLSPAPSAVDQVFSSMIGNVVTGRLETGAALNRAAGALSLLLQQ